MKILENTKYEFTGKTRTLRSGQIVHRIRALRQIGKIKPGSLGGWLESAYNLDSEGDCWVHSGAVVYGNAKVTGNAHVQQNTRVFDDARISDCARVAQGTHVYGHAEVKGSAWVWGTSRIYGNAVLSGNARVHYSEIYGHAVLTDNIVCSASCVHDYAVVFEHARVLGHESEIYGFARLHEHCRIMGASHVFDNAEVCGNSSIEDNSKIYGNAHITDHAICQGNADISGFTLIAGNTVISDHIANGTRSTRKDAIPPGKSVWIIRKDVAAGKPEILSRMYLTTIGNIVVTTDSVPYDYDVAAHLAMLIQSGVHTHNCSLYFDYAYNCYYSVVEANRILLSQKAHQSEK